VPETPPIRTIDGHRTGHFFPLASSGRDIRVRPRRADRPLNLRSLDP
jgi:hypothetical protein